MSLFGIILGLVLLIFLAFKGQSILWVAPICAAVVALFGMFEDPSINVLTMYTENYMQGMANFTMSWFPAFLLGAVFGKMMEATGAAKSVGLMITRFIGAKQAILAVVIACAALPTEAYLCLLLFLPFIHWLWLYIGKLIFRINSFRDRSHLGLSRSPCRVFQVLRRFRISFRPSIMARPRWRLQSWLWQPVLLWPLAASSG